MKRWLFALLIVGCAATPPAEVAAKNTVVVLKTSAGNIKIELFDDKAPKTVANFLKYVDDKHFDGTIFHRVIADFMIQGGGFKKGLSKVTDPGDLRSYEKKSRAAIKNESDNGLQNKRGTLAMARTSEPDSATAQFFINVKDNDFLDRANARDRVGYCVFGKVIEGMDVVDKIKAVKTKTLFRGFGDVPVEDVLIESAKRADK